jgi:3-oxoacyl-[acyl-carrier protein] reductase
MGRATAALFAAEGARVAVVDRDRAGVDAVVAEIEAAGGTVAGFVCDLALGDGIPALAANVRERLGPIDIVVNNAGVSVPAPISDPGWEDAWAFTMEVNLSAPARLVRACLADLTRNGDGRIVNIASTEGLGATKFMSPYTASKTGVVGLTRSLALELGDEGVTVNCICPGPIHTGMTAGIEDEHKARFARRRVPMRRYGRPEEVAHITLSLVLPAASYLTGAIIPVDGGMMAQNT